MNQYRFIIEDELYHYGVLGMKWGVRRYQRRDGLLTKLGKKRVREQTDLFPHRNGKLIKNLNMTNRDSAFVKVQSDYAKSVYMKDFDKYKKEHPNWEADVRAKAKKQNVILDEDDLYLYYINNARSADVGKKLSIKIGKKLVSEYAKATLQDLQIDITPQSLEYGKEWVLNNNSFMRSYVEGKYANEFYKLRDGQFKVE